MLQQKQRSVIKLSSMPLAMQEKAIKVFFQQFGNITRYCLKRHRYGRSLGYGYVECDHPEITNCGRNIKLYNVIWTYDPMSSDTT